MRWKRDTGAHHHRVLEYSGHVRKPGLFLKLPCLFGESTSIIAILSECSLWAIIWVNGTSLAWNGTTQAHTHFCPEKRVACPFKRRTLLALY